MSILPSPPPSPPNFPDVYPLSVMKVKASTSEPDLTRTWLTLSPDGIVQALYPPPLPPYAGLDKV